MRIAGIHGYHLGFNVPEPIGNALGYFERREVLVIRLVTEDGTEGWGETSAPPHAGGSFIQHVLSPLVLGQPVAAPNALWHRMVGALGYDRRGTAMMALSAVDMAIYDAAARMQGVSVAALLGGGLRDRAFAYASGPFMRPGGDPYRAYHGEVDALLERGFRAIKPRGGFEPRADGRMADAMRRQIGPDHALMVDFNQGYTPRAAIESARRMEEANLLWIEEPINSEDVPGTQLVARGIATAIAGGESLVTAQAFRDFLTAGTFSVLQPDLGICGGYTGFQKIAALAWAFNTPIMPHVFGTTVNFHAALQMAATLPAQRGGGPAPYPFIEYDATYNPLLQLAGTPALDSDGIVKIPQVPGTGIKLTPEMLEPWIIHHWATSHCYAK